MTAINFKVDTNLMGGFLTAVQIFVQGLIDDSESYIKVMTIQNITILYRQLEIATFIGISGNSSDVKSAQVILEYMILIFLSKFRNIIKSGVLSEVSQFKLFDDLFLKFCTSKEKYLNKWVQKECATSSVLQGILNNLINYFPIRDLVKLNVSKINTIGKKLIWVNLNIKPQEEKRIIDVLREKTSRIYGPKMFDTILKSVEEKISKTDLIDPL